MTTKLPEGVPVLIFPDGVVLANDDTFGHLAKDSEHKDGIAYTYEQLAERDKAIARAAFLAGWFSSGDFNPSTRAEAYLSSEDFKELTK